MTASKRVTIADIARLAGVSPGAVSFALNGKPGVSETTRARILAVAREHNFHPSAAARALVGARADAIGLAVNRPARSLGSEAFFTDLIAGIQEGLSERGISMELLLVHSADEEIAAYQSWQASKRVDGVIVLDPRVSDERVAMLAQVGLPAVVLGSHAAPASLTPSLWIDDDDTAHTLLDYLAALGHRDIAYVSGPAAFEHTRMRVAVLDGLAERGVTTRVIETNFSAAAATAATRRLLSAASRPTALVYDNDVMAVAGLGVAAEMGLRVPAEVSLASFDDSVMAGLVMPALTAMTRDTFGVGTRAAELLLRVIDTGQPQPSEAGPTPQLTVRDSTAKPPQR